MYGTIELLNMLTLSIFSKASLDMINFCFLTKTFVYVEVAICAQWIGYLYYAVQEEDERSFCWPESLMLITDNDVCL